jgi:predicted TPR repeat methyltransferase
MSDQHAGKQHPEHQRFDDSAATWDDDPAKVERGRIVAAAVRAAVPVGLTARVLEYGAGTGLTAQALVGHVGRITLADPSAGMRAVMEDKVTSGTFPSDTRVWDLDLVRDEVPADRFDLIVTVLALHHIPDLDPVLAGFATLLDDGGHLCIADLEEDPEGAFHQHLDHFHGHDGFRRDDLQARLEAAGLTDVTFEHCFDVHKDDRVFPAFLAVARIG